jgi:hypothetical protein
MTSDQYGPTRKVGYGCLALGVILLLVASFLFALIFLFPPAFLFPPQSGDKVTCGRKVMEPTDTCIWFNNRGETGSNSYEEQKKKQKEEREQDSRTKSSLGISLGIGMGALISILGVFCIVNSIYVFAENSHKRENR